jgi:hypothetical protein
VLKHSEKLKGPPNEGGPRSRHATTKLTFGHDCCAGRSGVVAGARHSWLIGGARRSRPTTFAPPTASVARHCKWQHAGGEKYAKRQHHPKPVGNGIHRYIPCARSHRPIPTRSERSNPSQARGIGRPITGIKSQITGIKRQTCARQPGVTPANVLHRKKFHAQSAKAHNLSY